MVKLAAAYDKMSNSLTKFGKALGTIDASKVDTFKNLNGGILNADANSGVGGIVNSVSGAVGSVVGGIGDAVGGLLRSVKGLLTGEKSAPSAATPGKAGKYGDSTQQLDAVIELLTRLNESTKSLDIYIKEQQSKNGGKSATAEK
jgi:phage-related protein